MVRSELVAELVGASSHLTRRDAESVITTIFDEIAAALSRGDRVELRGFGVFSVRYRDTREGRDPRTQAVVSVPPKRVPHFKPGAPMTNRLNGGAKSRAG